MLASYVLVPSDSSFWMLHLKPEQRVLFGRHANINTQAFATKKISKTHCIISCTADGVVTIEDQSTNGVWLDQKRMEPSNARARATIAEGVRIAFPGNAVLPDGVVVPSYTLQRVSEPLPNSEKMLQATERSLMDMPVLAPPSQPAGTATGLSPAPAQMPVPVPHVPHVPAQATPAVLAAPAVPAAPAAPPPSAPAPAPAPASIPSSAAAMAASCLDLLDAWDREEPDDEPVVGPPSAPAPEPISRQATPEPISRQATPEQEDDEEEEPGTPEDASLAMHLARAPSPACEPHSEAVAVARPAASSSMGPAAASPQRAASSAADDDSDPPSPVLHVAFSEGVRYTGAVDLTLDSSPAARSPLQQPRAAAADVPVAVGDSVSVPMELSSAGGTPQSERGHATPRGECGPAASGDATAAAVFDFGQFAYGGSSAGGGSSTSAARQTALSARNSPRAPPPPAAPISGAWATKVRNQTADERKAATKAKAKRQRTGGGSKGPGAGQGVGQGARRGGGGAGKKSKQRVDESEDDEWRSGQSEEEEEEEEEDDDGDDDESEEEDDVEGEAVSSDDEVQVTGERRVEQPAAGRRPAKEEWARRAVRGDDEVEFMGEKRAAKRPKKAGRGAARAAAPKRKKVAIAADSDEEAERAAAESAAPIVVGSDAEDDESNEDDADEETPEKRRARGGSERPDLDDARAMIASALSACEVQSKRIERTLMGFSASGDQAKGVFNATKMAEEKPAAAASSGGGGSGAAGRRARQLLAQPDNMGGACGLKLKEYQLVGLNWLWLMWSMQLGGILADEMGVRPRRDSKPTLDSIPVPRLSPAASL